MVAYSTFLDVYKTRQIDKHLFLLSKEVRFATQSLDAGNGDAHQVLPVVAGEIVLAAWLDVKTACPANSTADLGYGTIPNKWGNALYLDTEGVVSNVMSTTKTWNFEDLGNGQSTTEEVEIEGVAYDDQVIVTPNIYVHDLLITGWVSDTRFDRVTINLANMSGEKMDLGVMTINVIVNKAPLSGTPWVVASADTIDVTATVDSQDVNIDSGIIEVNALIVRP